MMAQATDDDRLARRAHRFQYISPYPPTSLITAIETGDVRAAKNALNADPSLVHQSCPFHVLAMASANAWTSNMRKLALLLLERGIDAKALDTFGCNALHYLIISTIEDNDSTLEQVQFFLDYSNVGMRPISLHDACDTEMAFTIRFERIISLSLSLLPSPSLQT